MLIFILRKLVASLLYPPMFCLLAAFTGAVLLLLKRGRKLGLFLLFGGLIGLLFLSIPAIQQPFIRMAEPYPQPIHAQDAVAIVVLGGGTLEWNAVVPATYRLSSSSLARAVEGIRLARKYPNLPILFTGGTIGERPPSSKAMAALALEVGIEPSRIVTFDSPTSTWEEAERTAKELGPQPIILVTSALHIPRATALFERAGLTVTPAPTDFLADDSSPDFLSFLPSANALRNWQRLFHELYGRIWARL